MLTKSQFQITEKHRFFVIKFSCSTIPNLVFYNLFSPQYSEDCIKEPDLGLILKWETYICFKLKLQTAVASVSAAKESLTFSLVYLTRILK